MLNTISSNLLVFLEFVFMFIGISFVSFRLLDWFYSFFKNRIIAKSVSFTVHILLISLGVFIFHKSYPIF
jgi:hypothetical protein